MTRYLLMTTRTQNFDNTYVPAHYDYLNLLKEENRLEMYGPFGDGSGGAYLIQADSFEEAQKSDIPTRSSKAALLHLWLKNG